MHLAYHVDDFATLDLQMDEWWKALEACMDGFWLNDSCGRLFYVNDAYCRMSGYSRAELMAMDISCVEALETPEQLAAHIAAIKRKGFDRFETLHRRKDGSVWEVEVSCSFTQANGGKHFAFFRDIGKRKADERALRASEEFTRRIIASSPDCIKVLDLNGRLLSISEGGQRLLEMADVDRYLGTSWVEFWRESDRPAVREAIAAAVAGDTGQFEAPCPTRRGKPMWWDVIVTPILDADGRVERLLAVSRDVTLRKHYEDELKAAKVVAQQASEAKSRFFAAAGHDLRQPFQAMRLFLEVLRPQIPPAAQGAFNGLDDAMAAGEGLLSALLDVALLDAGVGAVQVRKRPFDLGQLLAGLVNECQPQAEAKGLRLRHVPCRGQVVSDPVMLARILRNLLVNAVRYTEKGGVVVGCRRRGDSWAIQVADSGVGIAEADMSRLFEEFYQVGNHERDRAKGLGLGLSVVAKTAQLLGHKVQVNSRPGRGSVFTVLVPAA